MTMATTKLLRCAAAGLVALLLSAGSSAQDATTYVYKILATNDLGMHCVDADFSVFSILPPYNVVDAQVVRRGPTGKPVVLDDSAVIVRYQAIRDRSGSSNSSWRTLSLVPKSNFWQYAEQIYGARLAPGQGLKGLYLPKDAPTQAERSLSWNAAQGLFKAEGVPILPVDDDGNTNRYPLLRIAAFDKATGKRLARQDVVLPVSEETTCADCHATGSAAADPARRPDVAWSAKADLEIQSRDNVLKLHDREEGTTLFADRPVLCAGCHYSRALDLAGTGPGGKQLGRPLMSAVMHEYHADKMQGPTGQPLADGFLRQGQLPPAPEVQSCYSCHPGKTTQCLRGAMTDSVTCQNCHGDMRAVGGTTPLLAGGSIDGSNDGKARRPWLDLPRCQSCHTGDAVNHRTSPDPGLMAVDGLRLLVAFEPSDASASPFKAANPRFAENTDRLYRFSKGHGGVTCEGCHNSTHAIWANPIASHNDNVASRQVQGHTGTVTECSACHTQGSLPLTLAGPHGMHNVGDGRWSRDHEDLAEGRLKTCAACHGADYRGSVLSRTAAVRKWSTEFGNRTVPKGYQVGCYDCHNGPDDDD
jgi:hypothetical protein